MPKKVEKIHILLAWTCMWEGGRKDRREGNERENTTIGGFSHVLNNTDYYYEGGGGGKALTGSSSIYHSTLKHITHAPPPHSCTLYL